LKNEYENRKKDNNISSPPQITEKSNLVEVNNKLNISSSSGSSSSSSSNSSSNSSFSSSFGFPLDFIPFLSLASSNLRYSVCALTVANLDSNDEDTIDRLLKIKDNIPMHRDTNSVIYALSTIKSNKSSKIWS
jgi:hypothetical protein